MSKAHITIDEKTLAHLLADAISRRIARDFDTRDDNRTNKEILIDIINGVNEINLKKYLMEILNSDTRELYHIHIG